MTQYETSIPLLQRETRIISDGDLLLFGMIAEGQQATVRSGMYIPTGEQIAVKHAKLGWELQVEKESELLASLRHPNIVPNLYRSLPRQRDIYFAMPRLGALADLPYSERATALAGVAEGIDFAHDQGVIHRDIKVSNFLASPDGEGVLADFGNACTDSDPQAVRVVGSLIYTPPEVRNGGIFTLKSDVYSFAVATNKIMFGSYPTPNTGRLPSVEKAMAEDPSQRYGSATEFLYRFVNDMRRTEIASHLAQATVI